jgi:hypothetical protein
MSSLSVNGWKRSFWFSFEIPIPISDTLTRTDSPIYTAETVTDPFFGVNFIALFTRL